MALLLRPFSSSLSLAHLPISLLTSFRFLLTFLTVKSLDIKWLKHSSRVSLLQLQSRWSFLTMGVEWKHLPGMAMPIQSTNDTIVFLPCYSNSNKRLLHAHRTEGRKRMIVVFLLSLVQGVSPVPSAMVIALAYCQSNRHFMDLTPQKRPVLLGQLLKLYITKSDQKEKQWNQINPSPQTTKSFI